MIPKVTVIVPIYNVEPYLPRCLDSLCRQTLQEIEIIREFEGTQTNNWSIRKTGAFPPPVTVA